MLEIIKKNKSKTKHLTSGGQNQYGFISSIAESYHLGLRHGRSMNDSTWNTNPPEKVQPRPLLDPIEFILLEEDKIQAQLETENENVLNELEDMVEVVQPEIEHLPPASIVVTSNPATKELSAQDLKTIEKANVSLRSARNSKHIMRKPKLSTKKVRQKSVFESVSFSGRPSLAPNPSKKSSNSAISTIERSDRKPSFTETSVPYFEFNVVEIGNPEEIVKPSAKSLEPEPTRSRSSSIMRKIPNALRSRANTRTQLHENPNPKDVPPNGAITADSGTQKAVSTLDVADPMLESYLYDPIEMEILQRMRARLTYGESMNLNPFGSRIQLNGTDAPLPSLLEWTESMRNGTAVPGDEECWQPISLQAVAEFGKTLYTRRLLTTAAAAEKIGKSSRPKYIHDREHKQETAKPLLSQNMPLGSGHGFWETLEHEEIDHFGQKEDQAIEL